MTWNFQDHKTEEKFLGHTSCDECGSSDANGIWERHSFCFSCETRKWTGNKENNVVKLAVEKDRTLPDDVVDNTKVGPLSDRNITKETVSAYGVRLKLSNGVVTEHYYPYTNSEGDLVAWKKRIVDEKTFPCYGNINQSVLFGQSKFSTGGKYLTICEGEIDTMSTFQMNGSKFPVIGVKSSVSAYKDCKRQFEYIDSFDNIVICMDNDEPGQKAAKAIASLFPKKSKIMKLKHNDANVYLQKGEEQQFTHAWWQAEKYKPDDILSGFDNMWEIAKQPRAQARFMYPWDGLNKLTYGLRTSEFVVITAGSGMGKTQVLREVAHYCLKSTEEQIGLIYLEETAWETAMGLASVESNKPLHLPDTHWTEQELEDAYRSTWGTDRIHTLNDSWRDNGIDYLSDKIRFLNKGMDCSLIILDHISFMVSDQSGDERKMLDEIAHKLKALTVELDICLVAVCHSKRQSTKPLEEGGATSLSDLRGTAGIGQLANMVLGLERNGQHDDPVERNTTLVRVLKNRFAGKTGPACRLYYDEFTGRLSERGDEDEKE